MKSMCKIFHFRKRAFNPKPFDFMWYFNIILTFKWTILILSIWSLSVWRISPFLKFLFMGCSKAGGGVCVCVRGVCMHPHIPVWLSCGCISGWNENRLWENSSKLPQTCSSVCVCFWFILISVLTRSLTKAPEGSSLMCSSRVLYPCGLFIRKQKIRCGDAETRRQTDKPKSSNPYCWH